MYVFCVLFQCMRDTVFIFIFCRWFGGASCFRVKSTPVVQEVEAEDEGMDRCGFVARSFVLLFF